MIARLLGDATRRQRRSTAIAVGLAMVAAVAGVAGLLAQALSSRVDRAVANKVERDMASRAIRGCPL